MHDRLVIDDALDWLGMESFGAFPVEILYDPGVFLILEGDLDPASHLDPGQ
jgi:hypothetical protein